MLYHITLSLTHPHTHTHTTPTPTPTPTHAISWKFHFVVFQKVFYCFAVWGGVICFLSTHASFKIRNSVSLLHLTSVALYVMFTSTFSGLHHRYSRFQGVGNLTLHFPENFGGDATQIHYIGLKGEATQVISLNFCNSKWFIIMDDLNDVLSSHWICSWRGMLLQQLFMKLHQILLTTSKYFLLSRKF